MPTRREHRDEISDQEEVVEFEHFLHDEQPDRRIVARGEIGLLYRTDPILRVAFRLILPPLYVALHTSLNDAMSVKRHVGHISPRMPDCRRHTQRFKMPRRSAITLTSVF